MWERYCRGVNAIVFVLDGADHAKISSAKTELHSLIEKPILKGIPLLVLANKNDLADSLSVDDVIESFSLRSIADREVACYSISAKNSNNIDKVLEWLMKHATSK
jgi:ADP-ribosylation factor-like protein 8